MSHKIYQLENPPVVVFQGNEDYLASELDSALGQLIDMLEAHAAPVYHIVDLSLVPPVNVDDTVIGANAAARGPNPVMHHPMIKKIIYVTRDDFLKAALQGLDSEVFGHVKVVVFDSLEAALAFIREDSREDIAR
ncbi:MAG: hypothetical protein ACFB51_17840 [Anaerolineae bacterium]